jgi:murein DD-endopeptidase MepM/ murein hydrolase activator NlpD
VRRLSAVLLVAAILAAPAVPAAADDLSDARARQQAVQAELDQATGAFVSARDGLEDAQADLDAAQQRRRGFEQRLAASRAALEAQAVDLYQTGGLDLVQSVLGDGPSDLAQRVELVTMVQTRRAVEIAEARRVVDGWALAVGDAAEARDRQQVLAAKQASAVARLNARFAEARSLADRIQAREAAEKAAAEAKAEAEAKAKAEAEAAARAEAERAAEAKARAEAAARARARPTEPTLRAGPADPSPAPADPAPAPVRPKPAPKPKPRPAPPAPAPGGIACPVGQPRSYVSSWGAPRSGGRQHKGTDIMAPYGTPDYAYTSGVISRAGNRGGLGGIVIYLRGDNGTEYYYAHLQDVVVHAGRRVRAGQLVGHVGATGNAPANAPHTHFEVHPGGGAAVDPYPSVKRACG